MEIVGWETVRVGARGGQVTRGRVDVDLSGLLFGGRAELTVTSLTVPLAAPAPRGAAAPAALPRPPRAPVRADAPPRPAWQARPAPPAPLLADLREPASLARVGYHPL